MTVYMRTAGPRTFELTKPYVYHGCRDTWTVPVGFCTDLATTPRPLWAMFPPFGTYTDAAVLHDWLLSSSAVSRRDADRLFLRVMLRDGTSRWRAYPMFWAVRLYGLWRRARR